MNHPPIPTDDLVLFGDKFRASQGNSPFPWQERLFQQFCSGTLPPALDLPTLAISVPIGSAAVKLSFFGGIHFGRVGEPLQTADGVLLVASMEDLMATKLEAILNRAEARDYRDIAAMLRHGASLERGLGAFRALFGGGPATVLRALGWFEDGDLPSLSKTDRDVLTSARDRVHEVPSVPITAAKLEVPTGACDQIVVVGPVRQ
jgi:hypothetical protein